jgi:hypothetical protein
MDQFGIIKTELVVLVDQLALLTAIGGVISQ